MWHHYDRKLNCAAENKLLEPKAGRVEPVTCGGKATERDDTRGTSINKYNIRDDVYAYTCKRHCDTTPSGISGKRCLRSCRMW